MVFNKKKKIMKKVIFFICLILFNFIFFSIVMAEQTIGEFEITGQSIVEINNSNLNNSLVDIGKQEQGFFDVIINFFKRIIAIFR
jgi:hypothetical protein